MDRRKLQEVGGGTFTVSVPKEWAAEHGLEAGSTVTLYTHGDDSVVVRSEAADAGPLAETWVELDGDDPELATHLLDVAYATGFETVTLAPRESFSPGTCRAVREAVRDLVGTEIVVATDEEVTVRCLLDPATVSVDRTLVQLQSVALSVHRSGTATLVGGRESDDRLDERRAEATRLAGMVGRHFRRSLRCLEDLDRLGITQSRLFDYHETARRLDRVAGQGVLLARLGDDLSAPPTVDDEFGRVADATRRLVDDATTAVVGGGAGNENGSETGSGHGYRHGAGTVESARETLDRSAEAKADVDAVERTLLADSTAGDLDIQPSTAFGLARALDALACTADCGGAIADVALRAGLRNRDP